MIVINRIPSTPNSTNPIYIAPHTYNGGQRLGHGTPARSVGYVARVHSDGGDAAALDQTQQVDAGTLVTQQTNLACHLVMIHVCAKEGWGAGKGMGAGDES